MGGVLAPRQFLGEGPMAIIADEEVEAVPVQGQREAVGGEQLLEERGIAVDVLGGPKL
jgi:hypothetical protein